MKKLPFDRNLKKYENDKAAEFEKKSPKAAMALKMATKGAAKAAIGIVPGGKLISSGAAAIGKVASQQIYKRSPAARNQWWKNHLSWARSISLLFCNRFK